MEERLTRREALTRWAAVAFGGLATAVLPSKAEAANGDAIKIGQTNSGSAKTTLNAVSDDVAVHVRNTFSHDGEGGGVSAITGSGFLGVVGEATGMKTYRGPGRCPTAVLGEYIAPNSTDAFGVAVCADVWSSQEAPGGGPAFTDKGVALTARCGEDVPSALFSKTAQKGTAVIAAGSRAGVVATSPAGRALDVRGKAVFSRSGRALISAGHLYRDITCANLTTSSMILATLQGSGGSGVAVAYCKRLTSTSFRVVLTKAAAANVTVAWFVLN